MLNKNVEVFMACEKEAHEADIVLFGAPFDSTTSYRPGTRFGRDVYKRQELSHSLKQQTVHTCLKMQKSILKFPSRIWRF